MGRITIYADGGCSGNPGPGGWAAILITEAGETVLSGGELNTTNNRMELVAVIRALEKAKGHTNADDDLDVYTDSQYVKKGITEWIHKWLKNGWKNSAKDPVKNQDLWQALLAVTRLKDVTWHWVKGHAENAYNNRCDELAQQEIRKLK